MCLIGSVDLLFTALTVYQNTQGSQTGECNVSCQVNQGFDAEKPAASQILVLSGGCLSIGMYI